MPEALKTLIGRRIREERQAAGHRQRPFSALVGLDPSQLSRIESGKRGLDTVVLRRIADALELSIDAFFTDRRPALALAREGDAGNEEMQRMIEWAVELRTDIDHVCAYVAGRVD